MPESGPAHVSRARTELSPFGKRLARIRKRRRQEAERLARVSSENIQAEEPEPEPEDPNLTEEQRIEKGFCRKFDSLIEQVKAQKKPNEVSLNTIADLMKNAWMEGKDEAQWATLVEEMKEEIEEEDFRIVKAIAKTGRRYLRLEAKKASGNA